MKHLKASFISSFADYRKCPAPDKPEFAFIGRSNVGKSSLINMLAQQKHLAKTSAKPGKTQTINHYLINDTWYLVDLPGYGYANVSKTTKEGWGKMISDYVANRENLYCVFVLLDSRLEPQQNDIQFINWAGERGIPLCIVLTKTDKLSNNAFFQSRKKIEKKLLETWEELPPIIKSSSADSTGRDDIIDFIESALANQN